jgi:hypothetical protein
MRQIDDGAAGLSDYSRRNARDRCIQEGAREIMLLCTDCQFPSLLDDAATVFVDGSCICLHCLQRCGFPENAVSMALRCEIEAILAALDVA